MAKPTRKPAKKKAAAKKSPAKSAARKTAAKKPPRKTTAKKPARKKLPAKKSAAPQSPVMPWVDAYPQNVRWDAEFEATSLPDMFDGAVKAYGDAPCTHFMGATISYREMGRLADHFASGLQASGFGRGHRIGLFLPNTPYYVAAYFGILKTGATVVNFNPLYTVDELVVQSKDSGIVAMVTLDLAMLFDKVAELVEKTVIDKAIVCPFADVLPPFKRFMFKMFRRSDIADVAGSAAASKVLYWDKLIDNDGATRPTRFLPLEDVALLQYTGGTTGVPKGAMLTHANLTINVQQIEQWTNNLGLANERIMAILPFFHVFGMTAVLNYGVRSGAAMILMPRFEMADAIKLLRKYKPTIMPGVPTLYTAFLNEKSLSSSDLESFRFCISGGAPLPLEIRRRFEKLAKCDLVEAYGLSETSPLATCNPIGGLEKENSIGQPVSRTIVSIRSLEDPGEEVPLGESGEICIKGPQVMAGYWNRPDATERTMTGDYFRTGDVGYLDDEGFIYIIDRIKDMINCSGFKVYPRRIEDALYEHPGVAETTVIGVPDEYRGEAPKAFIVLKPGVKVSAEDILAHLAGRISKIELPEHIEFRSELPKTMVGKLSKKDLRNEKDAAS